MASKKIGLVLEGGSMRGMFTAGVIDVFMDEEVKIDGKFITRRLKTS